MKKRMMLYFGSFNPVHRGHIALAEYIVEQELCDEVALVVSPQNPLKHIDGLAPEFERFAMAEAAAEQSRFPDKIKASVIEFLLEKPSYTINTLNHLEENYGETMSFSILIGEDNLALFDKWRSYEEILERFKVYVYPREGVKATQFRDRVEFLEDAPLHSISSTEVREALQSGERVSDMIPLSVEKHIKKSGLWGAKDELTLLNERVASGENLVEQLIARGKYFHRHSKWGEALNDFNRAVEIDPSSCEAKEFATIINEILEYRYKDIYNP